MYIVRGAQGFDVASLRQGDILEGVPFPLLEREQMRVLGEIAPDQDFTSVPALAAKLHPHRNDPEWTTATAPVRFGFCAVLSNCCDIEPRNGRVLARMIVLARLRPISPDLRNNQDNFDSLRANRDPRDRNQPGYIDYFYLEPHQQLQERDWNVEFNQVISLPATDITLLLRKKILQLDDRTRMKFKIKLGFTYMRPSQDELAAGLENPWQ